MLKRMSFFWICLVTLSSFAFASEAELKARMYTDLEIIRSTFQSQYAPIEWKSSYVGWYLDHEIDIIKAKINDCNPITIKDYQKFLKQFFDSVQDYHVGISFHSTESAQLPFLIKSANGRYFFAAFDHQKMPKSASMIQIGDELLEFNKQPIAKVMQDYMDSEFNHGKTATDQAYANLFFSLRLGSMGSEVPKGKISLKVKHTKSGATKEYALNWVYHTEDIKNHIPLANPKALAQAKGLYMEEEGEMTFPLNSHPIFKKNMLAPAYTLLKSAKIEASEGLGAKESFLPVLGKKIWEYPSKSQFQAYIFEAPNKKLVGYVRIPHYMGSEKHLTQFIEIITKLQKDSDSLIIDQLNNPGGSVFYMCALASLLTDKPLVLPKHRISLTQKEVMSAFEILPFLETIKTEDDAKQKMGDFLDGYPVNLAIVKKIRAYFESIISEWNEGKFFTKPLALFGIDQIDPYPTVHYKKPIIILINELDLSCGDLFPVIFKDNGRAKLFGTKTAGAGGFVLGVSYPNLFGIQGFTYTGSMAQRANDHFIENLGVEPDTPYELNVEDLTNKYSSYIRALQQMLK